jgi:hypothetical protein
MTKFLLTPVSRTGPRVVCALPTTARKPRHRACIATTPVHRGESTEIAANDENHVIVSLAVA